ncbi:MAG: hypothetical protein H0V92_11180 [Pseudonocardiales bacterium]|nr:hypothetical protein [Pseudonocardiales bacterium]
MRRLLNRWSIMRQVWIATGKGHVILPLCRDGHSTVKEISIPWVLLVEEEQMAEYFPAIRN